DGIIDYRTQAGGIQQVEELVSAGVMTADQLLQIAPFLLVLEDTRTALPVSGRLRLMSAYMIGDPVAPPVLLQGRIKAPHGFSAGFMGMTTRQRPGAIGYDAGQNALYADQARYGVQLPKFFVRYKNDPYDVLL